MTQTANIEKVYRVGSMDQRVVIQSGSEAQQTNGEDWITWSTYATRWANVIPAGGDEVVLGDMQQPYSRIRVIMRYDSNVTEKYRLVWEGKTYNIASIHIVPRKRFLDITAESYSLHS